MKYIHVYLKSNTKKEKDLPQFEIDRKQYERFIENYGDFTWNEDTEYGKFMRSECLKNGWPTVDKFRGFYKYDPKKEYNNTNTTVEYTPDFLVIRYHRITLEILDMLWALGKELDVHIRLPPNLDEKHYEELKQRLLEEQERRRKKKS